MDISFSTELPLSFLLLSLDGCAYSVGHGPGAIVGKLAS